MCGEDCPDSSYCQECGDDKIRSVQIDVVDYDKTYANLDLDSDPIIFLPCGHFFSMSTMDGHMDIESVYDREPNGEFCGLKPLQASGISEKFKRCIKCREVIHSIRRYGRVTKMSELRSLERKYMQMVDSTLNAMSKKETKDVSKLKKLQELILKSPMRKVYEACQSSELLELTHPPVRPLLRCLEMLGNTVASKVEGLTDDRFSEAKDYFEEAVLIAVSSRSDYSCAQIRLRLVRFLSPWIDEAPELKIEAVRHLDWIIAMDATRFPELREEAQRAKASLDTDSRKKVIEAMNRDLLAGYDYGGSASSHWFQCPNGHPYFIGECGRAMQESRCIECGERVGGSGHRLLSTNQSAMFNF